MGLTCRGTKLSPFLRMGRPLAMSLIREYFEQSVAQLYKMDAESRQQCLCSIVLPLY